MLVPVLGDEPLMPEAAHLVDDRKEGFALLGQLVVDPAALARPRDESLLFQDSQALGQCSRANSRTGALELGKASRPL